MPTVSFFVVGVPVAQPRHRVGSGFGGRPRAYLPADHAVHAWRACVTMVARSSCPKPLSGPLELSLTFLLPRPKRLRQGSRVRHTAKPDRSNLEKAVEDAMNGIVWGDDSQVCAGEVEKWYAASDESPGVRVEVKPLEAS